MADTSTIICPHCKLPISLDEALTGQIRDKVKHDFAAQFEKEKAKYLAQTEEKVSRQLKQQLALEIKNSQTELEEERKRNQQLLAQLTELNKLIRELRRKDEERELQKLKELGEQENKIRQEVQKKAEEEQHLKLLEKDKQLQNALKEADELRRKLQQGSQQNQGEVLELELEKILKHEFPNDKISPVAKGVRGADLIQEVWDRNGSRCGIILWESKNAKWNEQWIDKLKSDQREIKAELAVIISEHLPPEIKSAAYRSSVWIAQRTFAVGIGMALRANLIQAAFIRRGAQGKNEKKEILWNYLTGTEFQQRMETLVEAFVQMKLDLDKEKRAYTTLWAKREKQITRILDTTYGLRGDLEGMLGNVLPQIKHMELPEK